MSPHLSHLNVAMAHRNYFRRNNLQILKLATYMYIQRLKITVLGANWQPFRLERIAKCSYFILSTQNIKFYWFVMNLKKFMLPIWWCNEVYFLLGINIWGIRSEWVKIDKYQKQINGWPCIKPAYDRSYNKALYSINKGSRPAPNKFALFTPHLWRTYTITCYGSGRTMDLHGRTEWSHTCTCTGTWVICLMYTHDTPLSISSLSDYYLKAF